MKMFQCDYLEGCHENILKRLAATNLDQTPGYGVDAICAEARAKIRAACKAPDADVHFLVGGTQTNKIVIASALRPYQGVLSADAGHVAVHETGAIESTGHKVLELPSTDGKITAEQVRAYCTEYEDNPIHEHVVQPGMVYISFPTESGTLYSRHELEELYKAAHDHGLPLFIDGARLGYGLGSPKCDVDLAALTSLCDVFYIGGTKCGALFGEAVVITCDSLKRDFRSMIKQQGAMLAKGRLLGIQFDELFTDDLYFKITKHAVDLALEIREAFEAKGIKMFGTSMTNQQFPILTKPQMETLGKSHGFETWGPHGEGQFIVRFCTSWATTREAADALIEDIKKL